MESVHRYASVCCARKKEKDEPESDENDDAEKEEAGEVDDTGNDEPKLLADFRHRLETDLRAQNRNLLVKDLMLMFSPASIYGQRAGFLKGLMVTVSRRHLLSLHLQPVNSPASSFLLLGMLRHGVLPAAMSFGRVQDGGGEWFLT